MFNLLLKFLDIFFLHLLFLFSCLNTFLIVLFTLNIHNAECFSAHSMIWIPWESNCAMFVSYVFSSYALQYWVKNCQVTKVKKLTLKSGLSWVYLWGPWQNKYQERYCTLGMQKMATDKAFDFFSHLSYSILTNTWGTSITTSLLISLLPPDISPNHPVLSIRVLKTVHHIM